MSGHTDFTWWIEKFAKYVLVNGKKVEIVGTYFTSDPSGCPNSDVYVLQLETGDHVEFSKLDNAAHKDLTKRYKERKSKKTWVPITK